MMFVERLTKINTESNLLKKAYTLWKSSDNTISMIKPLNTKRLLKFEVDSDWSGVIDLQEWFQLTYPELATLSASHITIEQLVELFGSHETQIVLPSLPIYEPLTFQKIVAMEVIEDAQSSLTENCFSIDTFKGKLWITKLSKKQLPSQPAPQHESRLIDVIPLSLKLFLGQSKISVSLLKQIKPGDILLIQAMLNTVSIDNQVIGSYKIENEEIMIDLHNLDLNDSASDDKDELQLADEQVIEVEDNVIPGISCKNSIPIKLAFILDRQKIKLSELDALSEGQTLTISESCYKAIEIEANGMPIAKGEIVIIDDNMAVEIKTVYGEIGVK